MTTSPTAAIVVGVDGSLQSMHAVDWATREAAARRCPLHIAHAALHGLSVAAVHAHQRPRFIVPEDQPLPGPDGENRGDHQTRLLTDALAGYDEKYPDVPVHPKIVVGRSSEVLIDASAGAALTVVGSRGRGGFAGLLLGSTSQTVLQHAAGPVAIVRAHSAQARSGDHAAARADEQIDRGHDGDE